MMEAIDPQTSELYIQKLKNILGDDWCALQLAQYKEFRENYSPKDLWSHRPPTTSPIVPLLFHHECAKYRGSQPLLGYWYGDPIHYLKQLACSIFMFEDYWARLPNNIGVGNIQYKLCNAEQFNGFVFELLVAVDSKFYKYRDCEVEPLFFDPRTVEGGADIVIRKGADEMAIQCKTRSPLSALDMSFDIFQYIFGCFYRLIRDSGHSYKLDLNLNHKLESADIEGLLDLLNSAVKSGLQLPRHPRNSSYDVKLSRLDIPLSGLSMGAINGLLIQDRANLFVEIAGFNPHQKNATSFNRIAICSVSASRYESLEDSVIRIVTQAAREARVDSPLILAIHLYGYIKWEDYLRNPTNRKRLRQRLDSVLKSYPRVKYVNVSSNRQEYADLPSGAQLVQTPHVRISNHYFKE